MEDNYQKVRNFSLWLKLLLFFIPNLAQANYFLDGLSSPFTTDAKYYLYAGSALTAAVWLLRKEVDDPVNKDVYEDKPLGRFSRWGYESGQLYPNILYCLFQGAAAASGNQKGLQRTTEMFLATLYSGGVTTVLKYTVREPRPHSPDSLVSFPSGHATVAFAFGSYVAAEHGWYWGVPSVLLAAFVGFSRINDGAHRLHDVIAGATIGTAYGVGMQKLGLRQAQSTTLFVPIIESNTYAFNFLHTF
jgi:membrane-associated phospholipid phosphatase